MNDVASVATSGDAASKPTIAVIGLDETGKPHASWFSSDDAELATKAASMMEMAVLPITTDEVRQAVSPLPKGKVFASGRAFVPFVKMSVYEKLVAFLPEADRPKKPKPKPKPLTRKPAAKPNSDAAPSLPATWSKIAVGSLVLATVDPQEPWFKCVVVSERANGLYVLRWRDFPDDPKIVRRREDIALLHHEHASA